MPKSHKGLVLREVEVKRGGKTFKQKRWVKAGEDDKVEKEPSKKEEVKGKESFKIGSKLSFMGKDLKVKKVSESEKTVKLSNGKVYTFDAIKKGSKDKKPKDKKLKININNLSKRMDLYKSGLKFHPDGEKMIEDVEEYTAVEYQPINSYMRNGKSGNESADKKIEHVSTFLQYAPKMEGIVFRGMNFWKSEKDGFKQFNEFIDKAKEGNSFMLKSFTSTSTDEDMAKDFMSPEKAHTIILEIKSKKGVYLNGMSQVPEENEVLFDKETKFNIIKIDKTDYPKNVRIIMEEI